MSDLVGVARSLQPLIREHADAADEARAPAASVIAAMADAGLFRAGTPAVYGGGEADPITIIEVTESVAEADGAAGWVLMVGLEAALAIAFMEPDAARSITTSCPNLVMCVSIAPNGRARPVDGGFVVSGCWQYVSGCTVADYFFGGCLIVDDDGQPQRTLEGAPLMRQVIVPRAECSIDPTWRAAGLTGTGSHDVVLTDAVVPTDMTLNVHTGPRINTAPYRLPLSLRLALSKVGVATGIARNALSLFATLAAQKTPTGSRVALRELPQAQLALADAEARLRSGRAFVLDTVRTAWEATLEGREISASQRALLRLACATCCRDAVVAVDGIATHLGMTATTGPAAFTRAIRDVRVVPQHFWVAPPAIVDAGRVLLGLEPLLPGL